MSNTPSWILLVTVAFAALGVAVILWWGKRGQRRDDALGPSANDPDVQQMRCDVCHHEMIVARQQLVNLSAAEMGLVVRGKPQWVKRKLAEYICPHCASAHVFALDTIPPTYLGADLYTPRARGNRCMECDKPMQRPVWAKGEYDGKLAEAPLSMDHGLECQFCKAVFCYECSERVSRTRNKKNGALYCPRCFRQPVEHVYHP